MPRPNYSLARDNLQRPSTIAETTRSSAPYRLRRLRGLINLYHWALEWAIHADADWTLGEAAYPFRLDRGDLWLLGIDQVADLLDANWGETAISAGAEKRDDSTLRGSFNPREVELNEEALENPDAYSLDDINREYTVKTHSQPSLIFDGRDWLTSVLFYSPDLNGDGLEKQRASIPFDVISPAMRLASNHVEKDLADFGITWDGPPHCLRFETGDQLLNYLKAKRIDGNSAVADLDQHRRDCVARIEKALRVAYERDCLGGKEESGNLVTIEDMANLAGLTAKAIRNRLGEARTAGSEVPEPVIKPNGNNPAKFDYAELRLILVAKFPKRADYFPKLFAEVEAKLAKSP